MSANIPDYCNQVAYCSIFIARVFPLIIEKVWKVHVSKKSRLYEHIHLTAMFETCVRRNRLRIWAGYRLFWLMFLSTTLEKSFKNYLKIHHKFHLSGCVPHRCQFLQSSMLYNWHELITCFFRDKFRGVPYDINPLAKTTHYLCCFGAKFFQFFTDNYASTTGENKFFH